MPTPLMKKNFACSSAMNIYGDLTDEQKTVARRCRRRDADVYADMCVRLLQSEIMLERGMVPDVSTYRSVFCTEGGDAPWMLDQAG